MKKSQLVLRYSQENPEATIPQVAEATGVSYPYTYKLLSGKPKTLIEPGKVITFHGVSDGSSADYYVLPEDAKELQDLISHKDMNAQIGEIFRACYRYGEVAHSEMLRDAKKIKFYAEAEIKRLERSRNLADEINEGLDHLV